MPESNCSQAFCFVHFEITIRFLRGEKSCYSTDRVVCGFFVPVVYWSVAAVMAQQWYLPVES
jgi:hypothetical protein